MMTTKDPESPFQKETCEWRRGDYKFQCLCRHATEDIPVNTIGPWFHKCSQCGKSFRCIPPRPTKMNDPPPKNRPCRCIEWNNGRGYYCSNACFWECISQSCTPHKWYL